MFDSVYNSFRGVETYFKVKNGSIKKNQQVRFIATGKTYGADEVGTLNLTQTPKKEIGTGDVGYLITGIKDARDVIPVLLFPKSMAKILPNLYTISAKI